MSRRNWYLLTNAVVLAWIVLTVVAVTIHRFVSQPMWLMVHVPLLGELHFPTALLFDLGVYLVVVGVMLDFLRSLGAQIDQQQEADADAR